MGLATCGLVGDASEAGGADPVRLPSPLKVDMGRMKACVCWIQVS
jgi:hypothetical protein